MPRLTVSRRHGGYAAILSGIAFFAMGIVQIVHSQGASGARVVGLAGHLNLALAIIGMIALGPVLVTVGSLAGGRRAELAGLVAGCGVTVLGLTCITSFAHGRDLGMFAVIAPVTNLAWFGGSVVIAVAAFRRRSLPRAFALGLPVAWAMVILGARFGGGVLGGAYYAGLGYLLAIGASLGTEAASAASSHLRHRRPAPSARV